MPGLENRVYFSTHDPQRQPVEISGRIVTEEGREVAQVRTVHAGRGSFHFTPEVARTYALEINEPSDVVNRPSLPPVAADAKVLLHVESSIVPEGSPLDVQLHALRPVERLVVAAYRREVLVGQQLIDVARFTAASVGFTCPVSLPLAGEAAGVLRVAVFDYQPASPAVIAQRLVFCRPQRQLKLQVRTADRPESADTGRAEDPVRLEVFANDELDRPVPAVIGAVVVTADGVPLAAQDESSLPAYYYLAAELDRPKDAQDLRSCLSHDPGAEASLDLLLGTQGWRRFPPASGDLLLADAKAVESSLERSRGRALLETELELERQAGAGYLSQQLGFVAERGRRRPRRECTTMRLKFNARSPRRCRLENSSPLIGN